MRINNARYFFRQGETATALRQPPRKFDATYQMHNHASLKCRVGESHRRRYRYEFQYEFI
jgi:hypothetical protein